MTEPATNPFQQVTDISPPIPEFEGRQVNGASIKIFGTMPTDELPQMTVSVDDRVRLVGEYKVVAVRHHVNQTGDLIREQVLKPMVVELIAWDESDPDDDGILRA